MDAQPKWQLHPQLAQDTVPVGDLPLVRVLASRDANYPWLLLVPRRPGAREVIDLTEHDQQQLTADISTVARALKQATGCHKLNIAAIGNIVPQLHVHVVARRTDDAAWPKPVWGTVPPRAYGAGELETFVSTIRSLLKLA
jgi:diadenosine tetraphosphate (Ap4A) HIT family hydrolase